MISEVYLISSLPALSFGMAPPISMEEFNAMAKNELSIKSNKELEAADIQNPTVQSRTERMKEFFTVIEDLQKELKEFRHARQNGMNSKMELLPKTFSEGNPLEREIQIMKWIWEKLEDAESGKTFTLDEVVVYKLKLQILHRLQSFDKKRGASLLDKMVNLAEKN